jgi:hypothetical protein
VVDPALRIQAATSLCHYVHGKRPSLRYIEGLTGMKAPRTIQEALAYQERLAELLASGQIDIDSASAILTHLRGYIEDRVAIELAEKLERGEQLLREMEARGISAAHVVPVGGLPVAPGMESVRFPQFGPPTIEAKPNPWSDPTPDVGAAVKATPGAQKRPVGRPRKQTGPKPPSDPKPDPEAS